jgi:hypothetical protein
VLGARATICALYSRVFFCAHPVDRGRQSHAHLLARRAPVRVAHAQARVLAQCDRARLREEHDADAGELKADARSFLGVTLPYPLLRSHRPRTVACAMPLGAFPTVLAAEYSSLFSSSLIAPPLARASADRDRIPVSSPAPSPSTSPAPAPALGSPLMPIPRAYDRERSTTLTPTNPNPAAPLSFFSVTPTSSPMFLTALLS